jgi:hypothetical protein
MLVVVVVAIKALHRGNKALAAQVEAVMVV